MPTKTLTRNLLVECIWRGTQDND